MPTGKTKDAGWQIGVSKTVGHPVEEVWETLIGGKGLAAWLGSGARITGTPGERYETDDGTSGEVRSYKPHDRLRLTRAEKDFDHDTTVQVAVEDKGAKTTIRFHEERLTGPDERERRRRHWKAVAAEIESMLDTPG